MGCDADDQGSSLNKDYKFWMHRHLEIETMPSFRDCSEIEKDTGITVLKLSPDIETLDRNSQDYVRGNEKLLWKDGYIIKRIIEKYFSN